MQPRQHLSLAADACPSRHIPWHNRVPVSSRGGVPTVIAVGDAVPYPPALGRVWDLGPVLVGVGGAAGGAAGAVVVGVVACGRRPASRDILPVLLGHPTSGSLCNHKKYKRSPTLPDQPVIVLSREWVR